MVPEQSADDPGVEAVLAIVRTALAARRAGFLTRVQRIEDALEAYRRAVDSELAQKFASEHGLAQPPRAALSAARAAELLAASVAALPELASAASKASESESAEPEPESRADGPREPALHPRLLAAVAHAKIVVIGALSGRDRAQALSDELAPHVEWIDTERDGAHAIGNLPQRIRQGRVAAVVILDRAVQHRHTESVMAAARDADVPVAFAGKGGKASLLRAAEQIELALTQRERR